MLRAVLVCALACAACAKDPPPAPAAAGGRQAPRGLPPVGEGSAAPATPQPGAGGGDELGGELAVTPELSSEVKRGDTVYLVVRSVGADGKVQRAPLAVDRLEVGELPMRFRLTSAHLMGGGSFAGPVQLTARLDRDGEAMTRQPGDLEGQTRATIPQADLKIVLDTKVAP